MKKVLLVLMLLVGSVSVFGQTSDCEADLVERAEMVAEIKALKAERDGLKAKSDAQTAQIATYERLNTVQEARIADLKDALNAKTGALAIDLKVESLYQSRIGELKSENERLRKENDGLRKSRERRTLISGLGGLLIGVFGF